MNKQIFGLVATALISSSALAEGGYVGFDIGITQVEIQPDGFSETYDADPLTLRVKGGGFINPNVAIEGYLGLGLKDDTIEDSDLDVGLENMIGLDVLGVLPLGDMASVYGKVGFAGLSFEDDDNDTYRENGVTYGVGAKLSLGGSGAITLDYTVFPDIENDKVGVDVEVDMISLGYQMSL